MDTGTADASSQVRLVSCGSPKQKLLVPSKFLPNKRSGIDEEFARSMWQYANHFSKDFPKSNTPIQDDVEKWTKKLVELFDFTRNALYHSLHDHLSQLGEIYGIHFSDDKGKSQSVEKMHNAILMSSSQCTDEYLMKVLAFIKLPQKHDLSWVENAQQRVMEQYDIMFPISGEKNFIHIMAAEEFNDSSNQRLRRGMSKSVGAVWYDRVPGDAKKNGTLEKCPVKIESKIVTIGVYTVKGHLLTKLSNYASTTKIEKIANKLENYDEYMERASKLWFEQKV